MSGAEQSLDNGLDRMGADIMVVPTEYSAAGESVLLTGQPTSFFSGIPGAFSGRDRDDGSDRTGNCYPHRQHRIALAGIPEQPYEPL
jgi:hypothetical protein